METVATYTFPERKGRQGKYTSLQNEVIYRLTRGDELFGKDVSAGKMLNRLKQVSYTRKQRLLYNVEDADTLVIQFVARSKS